MKQLNIIVFVALLGVSGLIVSELLYEPETYIEECNAFDGSKMLDTLCEKKKNNPYTNYIGAITVFLLICSFFIKEKEK